MAASELTRARGKRGSIAAAIAVLALGGALAGGAAQAQTIVIGTDVTAVDNGTAVASSPNAIAIGNTAVSTGISAVAVGGNASAGARNGVAIGAQANAAGTENAVAIGTLATTLAQGTVAIGNVATAGQVNSTAVGNGAGAMGTSSAAYGSGAIAGGESATAVGAGAKASNRIATATGYLSNAAGEASSAYGEEAKALGGNSTAIGGRSTASGGSSVALGVFANALANSAVALGPVSTASGENSIAIGQSSTASAKNAIAQGFNSNATAANGVALGSASNVSAASGVALGTTSTVSAASGVALGSTSTVSAINGVALGSGAKVSAANGVALGSGSIALATANGVGFVPTGATAAQASAIAATTVGNLAPVSVGRVDATRQIQNVAAGTLDSDAVNVSQLAAVTSSIAQALVDNRFPVASSEGKSAGTVGAAGTQSVVVGTDGVATGQNATAIGQGTQATVANATAVGQGAVVTTANSVALGAGTNTAAAVQTNGTTINGQNYTFANGTNVVGVASVGNSATGETRQLTNVAAGQINVNSTDAVNGSQLYATNSAINSIQGGGGIKYFHANSSAADSQAQGDQSVAIGPQSVSAGANSFAGGNTAMASGAGSIALGLNVVSQGTNAIALGAGSIGISDGGVALGAGASANRGGMAGQREAISGVAINSTQGAVSVGSAGNERQITNVAGGTQATDAVNLRQLEASQQGGVRYDTRADGSVNYNDVTLNPTGSPTTVHNVAPGVAGTDAVNVNQLNSGLANVNNNVAQLRGEVQANRKDAAAGTAGAMAMAALPQAFLPGKSMLAAGVAGYKGQSAIAIGLSTLSDNGRWVFKVIGSANSSGSVGVSAGAGFHW